MKILDVSNIWSIDRVAAHCDVTVEEVDTAADELGIVGCGINGIAYIDIVSMERLKAHFAAKRRGRGMGLN
jgi:hypothetical protein